LHPGQGTSLYCPFGPDAGALSCSEPSTFCCIGGEISQGNYADSVCQAANTACNNPPPDGGVFPARPVQCEEALDCTNNNLGSICCATGGTPALDANCNYYREKPGFSAISCEASSCPNGTFQVCATNAECKQGTCVAFKAVGMDLGFCM
jgi:hypothetical protein